MGGRPAARRDIGTIDPGPAEELESTSSSARGPRVASAARLQSEYMGYDRMDQPRLIQPAPALAAIMIAGLLGGVVVGGVLTWMQWADELAALRIVVRSGVVGFYLGVVAVLFVVLLNRKLVESTRGLAALVAVVALASWFIVKVLIQAIG